MTRDEMIEYIKEHPFENVRHRLFENDEFIFADTQGIVYTEEGYFFEDWYSRANDGLRSRTGGAWEDGWEVIGMKRMKKEEFKNYLREEYSISAETHRLISNILDFAECMGPLERNLFLKSVLDCGIGITHDEIEAIDF